MTRPFTYYKKGELFVDNIVVVGPDSLASILVVNRELEEEAEAFRLQPRVNFQINFNNYLEFIDKELNYGRYLCIPMTALKAHVANYQNKQSPTAYAFLKRAFFKDLCMGVMKEIYFAEKDGKEVSKISHVIEGTPMRGLDFIEKMYKEKVTVTMELDLIKRISNKRYPIPYPISERNIFAFKYALVLDYCASMGETGWSFNI